MPNPIHDELTLIPPRRLGVLLQQQRRAFDLTIHDVARLSEGRLLVSDLDAFEHGERPVDDQMAVTLAALYRLDGGPLAPQRSKLVIDVDEGRIEVGDTVREFPSHGSPQLVLGRYLALVQVLRAWTPGQPLPLRADDLEVLGHSLGLAPALVERRLLDLLEAGHTDQIIGRLRKRFIIPAAGLLVGSTVAGALVLVRSGMDDPVDTDGTSLVSIDAPSAAVVLSADSPLTAPGRDGQLTDPAPARSFEVIIPEIGDSLTVEPAIGDAAVVIPSDPIFSPIVSDPAAAVIGAAAESAITYPWRSMLPGWNVAYLDSDVISGNTNIPSRTITVTIPAGAAATYVSEVLAHELGHALDVTHLTDADRARWLQARQAPDTPWWPEDAPSDFHVGAGDFAEAVAALFTGSPSDSTMAPEFTTDQLELVAELLP